ncbi:MAG: hypothetical protein J3R72DRAFT_451097 [Linnemannia gamsii]|nr:MAG: hypothetical protein J3R72DRAFT_451097 [Linnemannia gamsii]
MQEKVLHIPELLHHTTSYLNPQDLFACIQVNHLWNQQCIPHLWHTIEDSTPSWDTILRKCADPESTDEHFLMIDPERVRESDKDKDQEWVRGVFRKYGRFIRVLSIHWPMVLEAASLAFEGGDGGGNGDVDGRRGGLESLTIDIPLGAARGPSVRSLARKFADIPSDSGSVRMSESLFPGYFSIDDFVPFTWHYTMANTFKQEALEYGWVLAQRYWHTILSNRHSLRRLALRNCPGPQWRLRNKDVFLRHIGQLKSLKELTSWVRETADMWSILETCPWIESLLDVREVCFRLPDPFPNTIVSRNLRTLKFFATASLNTILALLSLFPNLSTLGLEAIHDPSLTDKDFPIIASNSSSSCVGASLKSLQARLHIDRSSILNCFPNLKELIQMDQFDETLAMTLTTHCPRFEELRELTTPWYIDESQRPPADPTNKFLVDNACLRVFDSIRHFVKVDEMLRQPWACLGLEWLSCRIVGVDRLNEEEEAIVDRVRMSGMSAEEADTELTEEEAVAVEKLQWCQRQHHGVYDQLARLTRLKHLDLGFESRYPLTYESRWTYERDGQEYIEYSDGKTFDTLELSLESGLDRLGVLKNIEMFGFECLNHRIGKKELDWMAKNWLRLKLMYGLDKEKLTMIEHDQERTELKEYFEQLRPNVDHGSMFENARRT